MSAVRWRRLATAAALALAAAGCMNGRSSLIATQAPRFGSAALAGPDPVGGRSPIGPSPGLLASSGGGSARLGALQAPGVSVGSLTLAGGLSAAAAPAAARARAGVSITPALAPASAVGASVAAVTQPLAVTASAKAAVRTRTGLKSALKGAAANAQSGLGAVHVGG